MANKLAELRRNMEMYFSKSEIETIAFDFGIDYDNLRRDTKSHLVRDLINYMGRRGELAELVAYVRRERPRSNWPDVSELPADPTEYEVPPQATTIIHGGVHVGDTFNMSGDFRGAMLNIKSTLTNVQQQIGGMQQGSDDQKEELKKLLEQLKETIDGIPAAQVAAATEDAEAVSEMSKQLVEMADTEKPNKTMIKITGEGLKQAAQNLAAVAPAAIGIATQIVATVGKMIGG